MVKFRNNPGYTFLRYSTSLALEKYFVKENFLMALILLFIRKFS